MGKYFNVTVRPDFTVATAMGTAYSDNDVLFTWTKFEIPKGTAMLTSISGIIQGTTGAAGNSHNMQLYFAKTINGAAPPVFDTIHTSMGAGQAAAFRRHLIGHVQITEANQTDADHLVGYSSLNTGNFAGKVEPSILLSGDGRPFGGDTTYSVETQGFDTFFVAAIANGAFDFGTDVDLNQGDGQAASTAAVQITTTGTDPRFVFAPGDLIVGETATITAEVVSVDSATTMTIKNISDVIDQSEQLCFKNPIRLELGFEY